MARKKNEKLDVSKLDTLTSNPFAALGNQWGITPKSDEPAQPSASATDKTPPKSMLLVRVENRKHGRKATCIYHLDKDAGERLKQLKARLGTGGTVTDKCVELQGDHLTSVRDFFEKLGYKVRAG